MSETTFTDSNIDLFTLSLSNDNPEDAPRVEYDPSTDTYTYNAPPTDKDSSIRRYDGETGEFVDVFVPEEDEYFFSGMTVGPDGNFYVTQQADNEVLRFDGETGEFIDVFVEDDGNATINPEELDFGPEGDLYVGSIAGDGVRRFDGETGEFIDKVVSTNSNGLNLATGPISFGLDGKLYIPSLFSDNSILVYDPETEETSTFVPSETAQPAPSQPAFTPDGEFLLNGTFGAEISIKQYDAETGEFIEDFVPSDNNGGLLSVSRLQYGVDDNLYASDFTGNTIRRFDGETGEPLEDFISDSELFNPSGFVFHDTDTASEISSIEPENILGTIDDDIIEVDPGATDSEQSLNTPKIVFGGDGEDLIDAAVSSTVELENRLFGQSGDDELIAGTNNVVNGGEGNDILDASLGHGDNRLLGDSGDDVFFLGTGDRLVGGDGNDSFFALGGGDNTMTGGSGADAFWIANAEVVDTPNIITDFDDLDLIGVGGLGIGSTEDLDLVQDGNDVSIGLNDAELARVSDIQVDLLNVEGNFTFA